MDEQGMEVNALQDDNLRCIYQFLVRQNLQTTAETLLVEATGKQTIQNGSCMTVQAVSDLCEELFKSFENGDAKSFFSLWHDIIPEGIKGNKECKVLMLHLYVYFAVLPIQLSYKYEGKDITNTGYTDLEKFMTDIEKSRNEGMEQLRMFLDKCGKDLECETSLRPIFALPFIEDPQTEPCLSHIFERKWSDELTDRLHIFLSKHKAAFIANLNEEFCKEPSTESCDTTVENKVVINNNLPIVPNDRNIPIFLENDEIAEQVVTDAVKLNQRSEIMQTNHSLPSKNSLGCVHSPTCMQNQKTLVQYSQELALTKSHLCTLHSKYEKLKLSFHKLHGDFHKLMSVTGELTVALENSVKGEEIDIKTTLETCINIFPDVFNQNVKDDNQETITTNVTPISPKLLDFRKIRMHLINGTIKIRLFLLQALRQKITLSPPDERDEAVHEYISKDLFGLHGQITNENGRSILPHLLVPGNILMPHPLQQSAARLLNTMSSFRCGRDYLSSGSTVVNVVVQCLNSTSHNEIDAFTCNMLIATLQKLSLRKLQRLCMIEKGLVEWLIHHLNNECNVMGPYRLENATALLMNLSLHRIAQKRASIMAPLLISTLLKLLSIDHASALPYINGSLNNFLSNRIINEEAKKMRLSPILEHYRNHKSGEIRRHLDHILRKHRGEITISAQDEDDADDDNEEFDVIEDELEDNDPVKHYSGELAGEALLANCYSIDPIHEKNGKQNTPATRYFKMNSNLYSIEHNTESSVQARVIYNRSPRHSVTSKMTATSSMDFIGGCESGPTDIGKLSSIASL